MTTNEERRLHMRWWTRPAWILAVAALIASVSLLGIAYSQWQQAGDTSTLKGIATTNQQTLDRLDRNQAGIDELVSFVHDLQAQEAQPSGSDEVVKRIEQLLCSSTDVARQMACARLDINPVEVP